MNSPKLSQLSVDIIAFSPFNRRTFRDDLDFRSLVDSVRNQGVLEPVLVRNLNGEPGTYELLAGERRLRAAQAAQLETVPALVYRGLSDHEAATITVTENLHRADLTPLEEAEAIATLLEQGQPLTTIADLLGKQPSWVARRAHLRNLSPAWRQALAPNPDASEDLESDDEPLPPGWTPAHLELVARLEPATQDELLDGFYRFDRAPTLENLRRNLASYTQFLTTTPWNRNDESLLPEVGPCDTCPKRSSCHPSLFDDDNATLPKKQKTRDLDRCLDALCWDTKLAHHLIQRLERFRQKHPNLHVTSERDLPSPLSKLVPKDLPRVNRWQRVLEPKKTETTDTPVFQLDGDRAGSLLWTSLPKNATPAALDLGDSDTSSSSTTTKPVLDRYQALTARRLAHALDAFRTQLRDGIPNPPTDPLLLLRLLAIYGTTCSRNSPYDTVVRIQAAEALTNSTPEAITESLWTQDLQRVLAARFNQSLIPAPQRASLWAEAELLMPYLGLDPERFLEAAATAIPEPKSWAKS